MMNEIPFNLKLNDLERKVFSALFLVIPINERKLNDYYFSGLERIDKKVKKRIKPEETAYTYVRQLEVVPTCETMKNFYRIRLIYFESLILKLKKLVINESLALEERTRLSNILHFILLVTRYLAISKKVDEEKEHGLLSSMIQKKEQLVYYFEPSSGVSIDSIWVSLCEFEHLIYKLLKFSLNIQLKVFGDDPITVRSNKLYWKKYIIESKINNKLYCRDLNKIDFLDLNKIDTRQELREYFDILKEFFILFTNESINI